MSGYAHPSPETEEVSPEATEEEPDVSEDPMQTEEGDPWTWEGKETSGWSDNDWRRRQEQVSPDTPDAPDG